MHIVYLAFGSNLGDRYSNLAAALQRLRDVVEIRAVSSIYETDPGGYLDQPRFYNIVCSGTTVLPPPELLKYAKEIERALGRPQWFRHIQRVIGIDIILYD